MQVPIYLIIWTRHSLLAKNNDNFLNRQFKCPYSLIHFRARFYIGEGRGGSSPRWIRNTSRSTTAFPPMKPAGLASSIFPGRFWTHGRTYYLGYFDSEKWLDIPGFTDVKLVHFVTKRHTLNSSQKSNNCRLFLRKYSFSRYSRFMTTGEDRKKDRFKNWKICDLWKLPISLRSNKAHEELHLLSESEYQSLCSDFRNSWITPQGTEVLKFHLLQCIAAHLLCTLLWASWET